MNRTSKVLRGCPFLFFNFLSNIEHTKSHFSHSTNSSTSVLHLLSCTNTLPIPHLNTAPHHTTSFHTLTTPERQTAPHHTHTTPQNQTTPQQQTTHTTPHHTRQPLSHHTTVTLTPSPPPPSHTCTVSTPAYFTPPFPDSCCRIQLCDPSELLIPQN